MGGPAKQGDDVNRRTRIFPSWLATLALGAGVVSVAVPVWADPPNPPPGYSVQHGPNGNTDENVCSYDVGPGQARCFARVRTDTTARNSRPAPAGRNGAGAATLGNSGAYDPAYLESAYNDPWFVGNNSGASWAWNGQTVAIVDAYDDPYAAQNLAYYRSFFSLPACGTGCFTKVNENGQTGPLPSGNSGWTQEISLDLDMVSAVCPDCKILLVEANTSYISDLGTAVNTAVKMGANAVSNSYGGPEYSSENSDSSSYYNHPGLPVVVAAGDSGYGAEFPAASPDVTAVGGTSLNQATNTGSRSATETVWSGSGSGCSGYESKPNWQKDSGCGDRTIADTSAVADPNTGVWVYDTYGASGWAIFGGTSVATPIVSSFYALAQNPSGSTATPASYLYSDASSLNKVTSGSNGSCGTYLCNAADSLATDFGYNGPTGLGTPNGLGAFTAPPTGPTVPGAPTGLTATAGNAQVTLNWTAPTSTGNDGSLTYDVYRGTSAGGISTTPLATGLTSTSYTDSSVTNGTTYYYEVAAVNPLGPGPVSNEAWATPEAPSVPGAPTGLSDSAGNATVSLSWTAPTSTGNDGPITYNVYRGSAGPGSESATPLATGLTSTSYTDTAVTNGTTYYYEVAAHNAMGTGSTSNEVSATPSAPVTVPAKITNLTAKTDLTRGVDLAWTAPSGPVTSYVIYRSTRSGREGTYLTVGSSVCNASGACSYNDTGTRSGTTYYYEVAAVNSAGTGPRSNQAYARAK